MTVKYRTRLIDLLNIKKNLHENCKFFLMHEYRKVLKSTRKIGLNFTSALILKLNVREKETRMSFSTCSTWYELHEPK